MNFILTYLFYWMMSSPAFAFGIEQCGEYVAQGFVVAASDKLTQDQIDLVFVIARKSESETKLIFSKEQRKELQKYLGTNLEIQFLIKNKCYGECQASLIKVVRPLEPYQSPSSFFFPPPKPYAIHNCQNKNQ